MKLKDLGFFALSAIALASCTSDHEGGTGNQTAVTFASGVNEYSSRVNQDGDQWLQNDKVGIYMLENGSTVVANAAENVLHTAKSAGATTTFACSTPMYYPSDGTAVEFIAYHPYSASVNAMSYPVALADQSASSSAHDLMYACNNGTSGAGHTNASTSAVELTFNHMLSKVVLNVTVESGLGSISSVAIKGMNTVAAFDLCEAAITSEGTVADIIPYDASSDSAISYEAILLPVELTSDHIVEFTIDGTVYKWVMQDNTSSTSASGSIDELETGYKYTFNVSVTSSAVTGDNAEIGNGSTSPWGEGGTGEGSTTDPSAAAYTLSPAASETGVYADGYLKLIFSSAPTLGTSGSIKIYSTSSTELVDEINMADSHGDFVSTTAFNTMMDVIGVATSDNGSQLRIVNYNPVTVSGNTVIIKPHYAKLAYDTEYYVTIDSDVISHSDFAGISDTSWSFTTKSSPAASGSVTVDDDGAADFRTIQAAIDFVYASVGKNTQKTINIKNGVYEELLYFRGQNNLTFKGESQDGVIIKYDNCDNLNYGTGGTTATIPSVGETVAKSGGRAVILIESSSKIRFENLTIENTHVKTGSRDQAETFYFNSGSGYIAFVNCNLASRQDTIQVKGYSWFYNCMIAGDVDFIWGVPVASVFENCEIRAVSTGYVVQSRCAESSIGFVFLNCELTKAVGMTGTMELARSAGTDSNGTPYYSNITYANCKMDTSIVPAAGWNTTSATVYPSTATVLTGYKEYGNTDLNGTAIDMSGRPADVVYQLSDAEFAQYYQSTTAVMTQAGLTADNAAWFTE